jgi:iron complex outermembrane receptor protein
MRGAIIAVAFGAHLALWTDAAAAADPTEGALNPEELRGLDIEQLMKVDVTILSRTEEKVFETPAAITVITGDDVLRSGATSIPDALRWVPGLFVGRSTSNTWVVGAHGLSDLALSNKFLTLTDGRTTFSPFIGGTFWGQQYLFLPDLDRIEVIRGPGATVWGSNAVSGVINVITKPADKTQGLSTYGAAGTFDQAQAGVRYGGKIGEAAYRVYATTFKRAGMASDTDGGPADEWWSIQGGFRIDWSPAAHDSLTLQGDAYLNEAGSSFQAPVYGPPFSARLAIAEQFTGSNLLGRWTHSFGGNTALTVQGYFDRVARTAETEPDPLLEYGINTYDLDTRLDTAIGKRQRLGVGAGVRLVDFDIPQHPMGPLVLGEDFRKLAPLWWVWGQDTIALVPDRLRAILGVRFEHNYFSGFEIQGTARVAFTPTERQTLWAAVSRAVRAPAMSDQFLRVDLAAMPPATVVAFVGDGGVQAEVLWAYDIGYRLQLSKALLVDAVAFVDSYSGLLSGEPGLPQPDPFHPGFTLMPLTLTNSVNGIYAGADVSVSFRPVRRFGLTGFYSYLRVDLDPRSGSRTPLDAVRMREGLTPAHTAGARAQLDLPGRVDLDLLFRVLSALSGVDVDGYVELNARLAWRATRTVELSVVGQNLLHGGHVEVPELTLLSEAALRVPRSVYGRVDWRW